MMVVAGVGWEFQKAQAKSSKLDDFVYSIKCQTQA